MSMTRRENDDQQTFSGADIHVSVQYDAEGRDFWWQAVSQPTCVCVCIFIYWGGACPSCGHVTLEMCQSWTGLWHDWDDIGDALFLCSEWWDCKQTKTKDFQLFLFLLIIIGLLQHYLKQISAVYLIPWLQQTLASVLISVIMLNRCRSSCFISPMSA